MDMETCYACNNTATSKEHAPPKSFFPEDRRRHLITVPSCDEHNHANSPDVEYVRNSIAFLAGINDAGMELIDKAMRSYDRSPALLNLTFASLRPLVQDDQVAGTFRIDLTRLRAVIVSTTQALHYRDHGKKWSSWQFFSPTLKSEKVVYERQPDLWQSFRNYITGGDPCEPRETGEPAVFSYASHHFADTDWAYMYRLTFYEHFVAYTWTLAEPSDSSTSPPQV